MQMGRLLSFFPRTDAGQFVINFKGTFGHAPGRYKPGNSKARKHYPGASSANMTWNDRLKYRRQSRIFSALLSKLRYAYRLYPGSALACSQDQQLRLYPRGNNCTCKADARAADLFFKWKPGRRCSEYGCARTYRYPCSRK